MGTLVVTLFIDHDIDALSELLNFLQFISLMSRMIAKKVVDPMMRSGRGEGSKL